MKSIFVSLIVCAAVLVVGKYLMVYDYKEYYPKNQQNIVYIVITVYVFVCYTWELCVRLCVDGFVHRVSQSIACSCTYTYVYPYVADTAQFELIVCFNIYIYIYEFVTVFHFKKSFGRRENYESHICRS